MSYILCLETATTNCSVSLSKQGKLIAIKENNSQSFSHAEKLHCFIQDLLEENSVAAKDLAAIAVSKGPGSYTGLRIGVAAAKGLCYSLGIPLLSISTLNSLALQLEGVSDEYVIPMLDARRMEVYSAVYQNGKQVRKTKADILDETSFTKYLEKNKVHFIGDGASKFEELCKHPNAVFIKDKLPSSKEMSGITYTKFLSKQFEDTAYFEPFYLKDFVAG